MTYRFFAHDPDNGAELFKTQQEAIDFANSVIDDHRESAADGGWDELVKQVCWGEIKQMANKVDEQPAPEDSGFDCIIDYALTDVPPEIATALIVPEGWQLVPIKPTDEMLNATNEHIWGRETDQNDMLFAYQAMLTAAPKLEVDALISDMKTAIKNLEQQADNYCMALAAVRDSGEITNENVMNMLERGLNNQPQTD